jgi:hypothetical protein
MENLMTCLGIQVFGLVALESPRLGHQELVAGRQSDVIFFAVDAYDPDVSVEVTRPWENVRPKLLALQDSFTLSSEEDNIGEKVEEEASSTKGPSNQSGREGAQGWKTERVEVRSKVEEEV